MADQVAVSRLRDRVNLYFHKTAVRESSSKLALRMLSFFEDLVRYAHYETAEQLIAILRAEGELLYAAHSNEFIIRNMLLVVLRGVRDECLTQTSGSDDTLPQADSLNRLWFLPAPNQVQINSAQLRSGVLDFIKEMKEEINVSAEMISNQAGHQLVKTDTVMTYKLSQSGTLKKFFSLFRAKTIYSVDDDPSAPANVISSVEILSTMKLTTRVVLSAAAILPDGSVVAPAGTLNVCLAAKRHSVPVVFCAGYYKLTPMFIPHLDEFNVQGRPTDVLPASEALKFSNVSVANPLFDLIPAHLITLVLTQSSAKTPLHVYRLISDYYHLEDFRQLDR
uniref:Translation initiation factor eIF2B subunit beta n=1 Tax=Panagrellus redivivus TaxID=6233 RepID=A0A7E4VRN4_PANRE